MDFDSYAEGFVVDSDVKANWCVKKIREAQAEAERLMAIIAEERADLDAKQKAIEEKLKNEVEHLKGLVYPYFETVEKKETKTQQSYKVLDGTLIFKKPSVKIVKPDNDAELVDYLEINAPMFVETVKKPIWGEYKKNLQIAEDGSVVDTTTGEVVTFIKTEENEGSFDVKVV